eukprot:5482163-Prorocentrum_lima.AAC.1
MVRGCGVEHRSFAVSGVGRGGVWFVGVAARLLQTRDCNCWGGKLEKVVGGCTRRGHQDAAWQQFAACME